MKGRRGSDVFTGEVGGQVIKSVRLLAASSNLEELINAASQARGSANQLANRCLAMLMPREGKRSGAEEMAGVTVGRMSQSSGRSLHKVTKAGHHSRINLQYRANKGPRMKASMLSDARV